ncbi:histone H2A.Z-specific chaperone CHZ1 [Solanum tuberosum]|uniref:histone H2A.Z-specific chaperone CHZ1 n=1 Tax=Solanum tuberosum TaxID=4113 RepID=UPI00073A16B8|nr:PREDICTED: histone H2A.Z-specific chaperone CHZ1 [Solanum tuberosum]
MGGEISRVKGKNNMTPPNFLRRRLHDKRKRRRFHRPTKQSTPSKKELLSYAIEDDENLEGSLGKSEYVIKDIKKVEANDDHQEKVAKLIEAIVQEDDDDEEEEERDHGDVEDDDNNKDDQRMIKRSYDDEGPGSPSFRVYFINNNNVVEDEKINEVIIGMY